MKKVLAVAAITATMLSVGTGAYAATYVNGEDVTNEVFTTISNDYTLFPVRYLGEKLGCDVSWNPNDKCISVSKGDIHRDFYNGSAAEKYHADVVILSPDSETEEKVQKNMIRDLLKTDIQALAVSPIDSYECEEYVQQAKEKGISVYACDTPIEDADVPYIGIDNEKLGYELGEQLARALDHKGKIGVIAGDFNQAGHRMRVNGFEKYMEKEPGITIEMVRNGYSNMQVSQKDVDEILKKYPDLDGIMTTSAVTALGLAEATEGREISIVSVDAQEDALKAVQDGRIVALGAQSGYQIGYETIRYIVNDLEGKRTGEDEILDSQVLTTENIDAYIKEDKYSSS